MTHQRSLQKFRGYSVLELAIGLAIVSSVIVAGLKYYKEQVDLDQARILAKAYQNLNAAIGNYLTLYYYELRSLPPACSTLTLAEGGGLAAADLSNCALDIPAAQDQLNQIDPQQLVTPNPMVHVANAMQPTVTELVKLGLLHREASEIPPYAHHKTVFNSQGVYEPFRFAFLLEHVCVAAPRVPAVKNLPQCTEANQDLRTYVFNTQPYYGPGAKDAAKQASWLGEVAVKAGPDAAMTTSITPKPGELYGFKGAWELKNPLRNLSTNKGVTNMVVMVNGFGASGFLQFTRRDGSMWPTDNWDFNQKDITNMRRIEVTDRMKIPKKKLGDACDFATESTAFDDDARALMICDKDPADEKKFKWLHTRGKGAANWDDYIDVTLIARPNTSNRNSPVDTSLTYTNAKGPLGNLSYFLLPSPADWTAATFSYEFNGLSSSLYGMPTVIQMNTLGYNKMIDDSWCTEHEGTAHEVVSESDPTKIGLALAPFLPSHVDGEGAISLSPHPLTGFLVTYGAGLASTICVFKNKSHNWQPVAQTPEFKLAVNPANKNWQLYTDMRYGGQLTVRFHKLYQ